MNIGITTVAHNKSGYYVQPFIDFIAKSSVYPHQVTIVLGQDHGYNLDNLKVPKNLPNLTFLLQEGIEPSIAMLTNIAIESTETEWIMPMDIDSQILPNAIKELEKLEDEADCLCIAWREYKDRKTFYKQSPLPETIAKMQASKRPESPIHKSSPFRRRFWVMRPYDENNMQQNFLDHLVEQDARFVKVTKPCILIKGVSNA